MCDDQCNDSLFNSINSYFLLSRYTTNDFSLNNKIMTLSFLVIKFKSIFHMIFFEHMHTKARFDPPPTQTTISQLRIISIDLEAK